MNRPVLTVAAIVCLIILNIGCKGSAFYHKPYCNSSDYEGFRDFSYALFHNDLAENVQLNTIKYYCPASSFSIKKVMFDRFGKWDESRYLENDRHPVLIWKNVEIFNDSKLFHVAAYGEENDSTYYTAVMLFDKEWNDQLKEKSPLKVKIADYFSQLLKNENKENSEFYSHYWNEVNTNEQQKTNP